MISFGCRQLWLGWLRCTMDQMRTVCVTGVFVAVFGLLLLCNVHASDTQRHDSDEAVAYVRQKRFSLRGGLKTRPAAGLKGSTQLRKASPQRTSGSDRSIRTQSSGSDRSIRTQSYVPKPTRRERVKSAGKGFVRYAAPFVAAAGASALGGAVGGIIQEEYARSRKNRAPRFSVCPPNKVMTAPAREKKVEYKWDIPNVTDPDGEILRPVRTMGPPPGSDFEEGITEIHYTVSDSEGLTALCTFSVTVRVKRCPFPPEVERSVQRCDVADIYGSVCYHTCSPGYHLNGSYRVTCQENEQWSEDFPKCTENKAPYFEYCPSDATVTAPARQTGAIYTWNVPTVLDPEGETLSSVRLQGPASGDEFKEGVTTVKYTVRDSKGLSSSCSFQVTVEVKRCRDPPVLSLIDQYCDMNEEYVYGSVCLHTCPSGYNLVGSANVTCQEENGKWSTDFPWCDAITCQPLSPPSHGFIHCTNDIQIGSACDVSCDRGYQVHGNATVLCLDDGTWSRDMAECGGIECQAPPVVAHGHYDCPSGLQHPASCSLVCDEGFTASSIRPTTIECQASGIWTRLSTCIEQA